MEFSNLCICFGAVVLFSYFYIKWLYSYWERKNVPHMKPTIPFGNLGTKNLHLPLIVNNLYTKFKRENGGPVFGMYFFYRPVLIVTDLELVRNIFIKDFQYFPNRGIFHNEKHDPISANVANVDFEQWKKLRSKLTPTFSSGKMKLMLPTIVSVADRLHQYLGSAVETEPEIEIFDWLKRFTVDVIGVCAFGIECSTLKGYENNKLWEMVTKAVNQPKLGALKRFLIVPFENVAKIIGVRTHHKDVSDYFMNEVREIVEYREKNNVRRNDFMSLLIDLKNSNDESKRLTMNEISAQAFAFLLAGFDTSSSAMGFCLYELALEENKHIQTKVEEEIATVLEKHDGLLTYEAVQEMTYMDQVMNETLRKHPPAAYLVRVAVRDYKVPNTDIVVPKGMQVIVPTLSIHHDPGIYDDPEAFRPERFTPEHVESIPSCAFIPFGEGPRNCIAARFGKLQAKIGVIKLLNHFEFSTCSKTTIPMKYHAKKLTLSPVNGLWLKVTARPK